LEIIRAVVAVMDARGIKFEICPNREDLDMVGFMMLDADDVAAYVIDPDKCLKAVHARWTGKRKAKAKSPTIPRLRLSVAKTRI
jgi:hypothetical protein